MKLRPEKPVRRQLWLLVISALVLPSCISEPASGTKSISVYTPYAPVSQPNPMAIELSAQIAPARPDAAGDGVPPPPPVPPIYGGPPGLHLVLPVIQQFKGPALVCKHSVSVRLLASETALTNNTTVFVRNGPVEFSVEGSSEPPAYKTEILNVFNVAGVGPVERHIAPDPTMEFGRFRYRFQSPRDLFGFWEVSGKGLEGTDADLAVLRRIGVDEGAKAGECSPRIQ